jgi:hypothetical protein
MATPILTQILDLINTGQSVAQAVETVIPGADVATWERHIARAQTTPAPAKPQKKQQNRRRSSGSKKSFAASSVLALSGAERQGRKQAEATVELIERKNGDGESRAILVNLPAGMRLVA